MTIDQMLELCKLANIVHFPQGVVVTRQNNGLFLAGIATKDAPFYPYSSTNKTADGALADLKNHIANAANRYAQSKEDEANRAREAVNAVMGAKR